MTWAKNKSRIGDIAEQYAILWLSKQGHEVFPNFACSGPVDLIAVDPITGKTIMVDVKKINRGGPKARIKKPNVPRPGTRAASLQRMLRVQFLMVDIDSGECEWWKDPEGQIQRSILPVS